MEHVCIGSCAQSPLPTLDPVTMRDGAWGTIRDAKDAVCIMYSALVPAACCCSTPMASAAASCRSLSSTISFPGMNLHPPCMSLQGWAGAWGESRRAHVDKAEDSHLVMVDSSPSRRITQPGSWPAAVKILAMASFWPTRPSL